jgi:AcrR family transcriptional regulator
VSAAPTRSPGRPRSAEADLAIARATLELLVEEGFRGLSVEAVRRRAGVGKATIYRRFPDKSALVRAAMDHLHAALELPDTGTLRGDLEAVWRLAYSAAPGPRERLMLVRLLADVVDDEEMFAVFRETLVDRRRAGLRELLQRGVDRGELGPGTDLDLLLDILAGPIVYRFLIDAGEMDDPVARALRIFDTVMEGLAPATPAPPSRGRPRG